MSQPNMNDVVITVAHRHYESLKGDISQAELQQALLDAVGGGQ